MHKRQRRRKPSRSTYRTAPSRRYSQIERQSDYIFVYDNILDIHRKVTLKVTNQPISAVLNSCSPEPSTPGTLGRQIASHRALRGCGHRCTAKIARITVSSDQNNDPLIGVTIRVKARPSIGTATDINGKYLLDVYPDEVLEFSYVGYKPQDVSVAGQEIVDVVMQQNDAILDAVEVVGYGVQKKISVIGSQQTIATKELKVPSPTSRRASRAAYQAAVSVRTSEPGEFRRREYLHPRHRSTLTASMSALLTPSTAFPVRSPTSTPKTSRVSRSSRDASATTVYGVRGANGVIIINTKRFSADAPNKRYVMRRRPHQADQRSPISPTVRPTWRCRTKPRSPRRRQALQPGHHRQDPPRRGTRLLYPDVDWMKQILRDFSHNRSANVNVQGGSDKAVYYIGLAYYDENGVLPGHETGRLQFEHVYRRYNVTSNLTLNPFAPRSNWASRATWPTPPPGIFAGKHFQIDRHFTPPTHIAPLYPDGKLGAFFGRQPQSRGAARATGYATSGAARSTRTCGLRSSFTKGSVSGMFSFDTYNYTSNRFTKLRTPSRHGARRQRQPALRTDRQGTENPGHNLSARVTAPSTWRLLSTTATPSAATPYRA